MMFAVSVACSLTGHVQLANTLEMIAHSVRSRITLLSGSRTNGYSDWQMRPFFPYGTDFFLSFMSRAALSRRQHCLLTWIQQDASKGLCPMCRQSEFSDLLDEAFNSHGPSRVRMEAKRRLNAYCAACHVGWRYQGRLSRVEFRTTALHF